MHARLALRPASRGFASAKIVGQINEPFLDLRSARVGQQINIPYDVTVGSGLREQWQSTFYQHDRLYTSRQFAQGLNFRDTVLPFSMMLFNTISMSHVDPGREVLDVGLENAQYVRPAYEGDTFHKSFTVKSLRRTKTGDDSVIQFRCELFNQHRNLVFAVDKSMMFRKVVPADLGPKPSKKSGSAKEDDAAAAALHTQSHLYAHLMHNAAELPQEPSLARLESGTLLLHDLCRPLGRTANRSLATSFRLAHPLLLNHRRYPEDELVVSGGMVLSAAMAASSRCFYEVLTESLVRCSFLNRVHPQDLVGALSFVAAIRPIAGGALEEVSVRTVGLKNCDVSQELKGVELPRELFTTAKLRREPLEALVQEHCPQLAGKLAVVADRILVRQSPFAKLGFMPLL